MERSFEEILNLKIQEQQDSWSSEYQSTEDISCLLFLMQNTVPRHFKATSKYKQTPPPAAPVYKPHELSEQQKEAWNTINMWLSTKATLSDHFTVTQLKKAFRTLALAHHPDKGGSSEIFQSLFQSYKILLDFCLSIK